jgi:hypothetical protein
MNDNSEGYVIQVVLKLHGEVTYVTERNIQGFALHYVMSQYSPQ